MAVSHTVDTRSTLHDDVLFVGFLADDADPDALVRLHQRPDGFAVATYSADRMTTRMEFDFLEPAAWYFCEVVRG
jgi:hypothetical protein